MNSYYNTQPVYAQLAKTAKYVQGGRFINETCSLMELANAIRHILIKESGIPSSVWSPAGNYENVVYIYLNAKEFEGTKTYYILYKSVGGNNVAKMVSHRNGFKCGNVKGAELDNENALKYYINELLIDKHEMPAIKK